MNVIRLIIFTIVVPGFVLGYVPYSLYNAQETFGIGFFRYTGLILISVGVLLYIWSVLSFLIKGNGTPAIWFTKYLKILIGEEPIRLVSSGLYKTSRNPMYLGVLMIVFGLSILLESKTILIYTGILGVFFHIVVIFLEEPHLKKNFGKEYELYLKKTHRWFGLKSMNNNAT